MYSESAAAIIGVMKVFRFGAAKPEMENEVIKAAILNDNFLLFIPKAYL